MDWFQLGSLNAEIKIELSLRSTLVLTYI